MRLRTRARADMGNFVRLFAPRVYVNKLFYGSAVVLSARAQESGFVWGGNGGGGTTRDGARHDIDAVRARVTRSQTSDNCFKSQYALSSESTLCSSRACVVFVCR